jgi:hypothetical protein
MARVEMIGREEENMEDKEIQKNEEEGIVEPFLSNRS